jgi:hypothetical protein
MAGTKRQRLREVEMQDDIECRSCGAPTNGAAICRLCFEAITELRALAVDHDEARTGVRAPRARPARQLAGSRRNRS